MSIPEPHFELARLFDDGSEEAPAVVRLTAIPSHTRMSRRGFVGTAVSAAAALVAVSALADGCRSTGPAAPTETPTPKATPTPMPTPTPLPDRKACEEIRGTEYRSPTEREWFLKNCTDARITYTARDVTGQIVTYTMPCGSPIPPGATCTCNCVPSAAAPPVRAPGRVICTCDKVCTCVPVFR